MHKAKGRRLLVVGGDLRMELMGHMLARKGHSVAWLNDAHAGGWQKKAAWADGLLLPYPYTLKDGGIPGWEHGGVEALLEKAKANALVMTGAGLTEDMIGIAKKRSLHCVPYADDSLFVERNAEISAEAAVYEAMQRSKLTLADQNVLVLGYGTFAKAIVWRLRALGARVWVAARREKSRLLAAGDGAQAVDLTQIPQLAPQMQLVMNTIPSVVLGRETLSLFPDDTLLLELASPPYGIDLSAAVELEKNVIVLPGLPGRYAPGSAAAALKEAVLRQIGEGNV